MNWKNVGSVDRTVRALLGAGLLAAGISPLLSGALAFVTLALGAVLLTTAIVGSCPLYLPCGIDTHPRRQP